MRRWDEDEKMRRRCEDEKMWRWEDERQTPTIGRTLRSDALGEKVKSMVKLQCWRVYTPLYTPDSWWYWGWFLWVSHHHGSFLSPARPKDELGEILDKSRVRKFRFGAEEDEDDVDYNMRSLDVWCWPMVKKLVNNGKSVNHQYWLFWPWHMKNLEQNPTNSSIWLGKPMVLGCYPLDTEITPRLQQLAVSAKPVDRRLETRIGAGRLLPPTTVKWF
jgi:hypothetical protein